MTGMPLLLTTARWVNRQRRFRDSRGSWSGKWSKVLAHYGPYEQFRYGCDHTSDWHVGPRWGPLSLQICLICYRGSGLIGVDVDGEQAHLNTRTGQLVGRANAISAHGRGYHVVIDARTVPLADWPRQGPYAGGTSSRTASSQDPAAGTTTVSGTSRCTSRGR